MNLFKTQDEQVSVDVHFEGETVWLTQERMAVLFWKVKYTFDEHIKNIYAKKVFYRQVLDIYVTSIDYNPKSGVSIEFF